jgi:cytoplasmic FMR1 interacting protein
LYTSLIKLVDLLLKLDSLKDMKACLQNDFSSYKRAFQLVRNELPDAEEISAEVHNLQMFLGNPQHPKSLIFHNLKTELQKISGFEDVFVAMLSQAVDYFDQELYVTPEEKWALLRALPHIMLLLDGDSAVDKKSFNVFKSKKVALAPLQKLFKRFPVVPVYGDMSIKLVVILTRASNWDETTRSSWVQEKIGPDGKLQPDPKVQKKYSLLVAWQQMRAESDSYCPKLVNMLNEVKALHPGEAEIDEQVASDVYHIVKEGLCLCSKWTASILEQVAWKYQYPASQESLTDRNVELDSPGIEYEKAVRYNYSKEELSVLVDCVSIVKALNGLMMKAEGTVASVLRYVCRVPLSL